MKQKQDTYSYKGWLVSDNFLKRAFAVLGYQFVAGMIVYVVILIVVLVFVMAGMAVSMVVG
ncbi:MAG: hypothetical protein R6U32_05730 [Candidatus Woesearchaeota archaeon]